MKFKGGAYKELPSNFKHTKSVINVKYSEKDEWCYNKCFMLCVLVHEFHKGLKKNKSTIKKYKNMKSKYNFDGVNYPACEKDINKFMKNNPNTAVNVFYLNDVGVPFLSSKYMLKEDTINLLFYDEHYVYIKNLNALIGGEAADKSYICPNYSCGFSTEEFLHNHITKCINNEPAICKLTKEVTKFNHFTHMNENPFFIVCDFEAFTTTDQEKQIKGELQHHLLASAGVSIIAREDIKEYVKELNNLKLTNDFKEITQGFNISIDRENESNIWPRPR